MDKTFLQKYFEFACSVTDAPPMFHEYLSLATAGIIIGRGRYIRFGDDYIFPNLWLVVLAPTTIYRKSTSLTISRRAIKAVNPAMVLPDEFSHEAMLKILSDQSQGVFYYMEFRSMMELLRRDYMSGTKSVLTSLYDCPDDYYRKLQEKELYIKNPFISILSATTTSWFMESIKEGDLEGGFLTRFIFVESGKKLRDDAFPAPSDLFKKEEMLNSLLEIQSRTQTPAEMVLSDDAMKLYTQFYKKFVNNFDAIPGAWQKLLARLNIVALKFALIIECCHTDSLKISEKSMTMAIHAVEALMRSTASVCDKDFSTSYIEKQTKRVLSLLVTEKKISRADLYRKLSNLKKMVIEDVLSKLKESEQLVEIKETHKDGRPTIYYAPSGK